MKFMNNGNTVAWASHCTYILMRIKQRHKPVTQHNIAIQSTYLENIFTVYLFFYKSWVAKSCLSLFKKLRPKVMAKAKL